MVVIGSHLDSVPHGGNFDGAAGVLAGLAAVAALRDMGLALECDIVVMGIRAEESVWFPVSYIGSRGSLGTLPDGALDVLQGRYRPHARRPHRNLRRRPRRPARGRPAFHRPSRGSAPIWNCISNRLRASSRPEDRSRSAPAFPAIFATRTHGSKAVTTMSGCHAASVMMPRWRARNSLWHSTRCGPIMTGEEYRWPARSAVSIPTRRCTD